MDSYASMDRKEKRSQWISTFVILIFVFACLGLIATVHHGVVQLTNQVNQLSSVSATINSAVQPVAGTQNNIAAGVGSLQTAITTLGYQVSNSTGNFAMTNILASNQIRCAVDNNIPGFSNKGVNGAYTGFEADMCTALLTAVFGPPVNTTAKVVFVPVNSDTRFPLLTSRSIDVIMKLTTGTLTRDSVLGVSLTTPMYIDSTSFVVRSNSGITTSNQLSGASNIICLNKGASSLSNVQDYFSNQGLALPTINATLPSFDAAMAAVSRGECTAAANNNALFLTTYQTYGNLAVLPEKIGIEVDAAAVLIAENDWREVVSAVIRGLVTAEYLGISSSNVDTLYNNPNTNAAIKRFLGEVPSFLTGLNVPANFMYNVIKQVGNYGEIFARNLAPYGIQRGFNQLYSNGGLFIPTAWQ